jgi:hypothetical protein
VRRVASDAQLRLSAARKAAYDDKRKVLVTELEEHERAFKKSRLEQEIQREGEDDCIKEAADERGERKTARGVSDNHGRASAKGGRRWLGRERPAATGSL